MDTIHWQFYPHVAENPHGRNWLETQAMLGLANNTIRAYARSANDYLAFCQRTGRPFLEVTKADIVAYIDDMNQRPNPKGDNIRYLHWGGRVSKQHHAATAHRRAPARGITLCQGLAHAPLSSSRQSLLGLKGYMD